MKRNQFFTEPISCDISEDVPPRPVTETVFEKRRGISDVEVRPGYTQVHVSKLEHDLPKERIKVLSVVSDSGIAIDFLKLTPSGMSFLVPREKTDLVESALKLTGAQYSLRTEQSIVIVHAVNMRDEEGMIAGIVRRAIESGISVDHVTDMHDRMLLVMKEEQANRFAELMKKEINVA